MTILWTEVSPDEWHSWCATVNKNAQGRWVGWVHYTVDDQACSIRLMAVATSDEAMSKTCAMTEKLSRKEGYVLSKVPDWKVAEPAC